MDRELPIFRLVKEYCDCDTICAASLDSLESKDLSPSIRNLVVGNLERHLDSCARALGRLNVLQRKGWAYEKGRR